MEKIIVNIPSVCINLICITLVCTCVTWLCVCIRTGSKLGISPLMLAAMNGHTSAVKLLLDTGADINAQVCTNKILSVMLYLFLFMFFRSRLTGTQR